MGGGGGRQVRRRGIDSCLCIFDEVPIYPLQTANFCMGFVRCIRLVFEDDVVQILDCHAVSGLVVP